MSLINISNLSFAYDGTHDAIFDHMDLQLDSKWKLGFIGRNGRGKTTFLHLLCGKYPYSGTISASVTFSYFPFEVKDKRIETLALAQQLCGQTPHWQLLRELSLLELDESVLYRPFDSLSNGEQTKIMLAALFLREDDFLLIDEPTNHLDAHGRRLVSAYLSRKQGFILVSHDRAFLDGCIDHVLSINRANIELQQGNFSSWLFNKERQDQYELAEHEKHSREIKRLTQAARQSSSWSDRVEQTKYGTKNSGLKPDKGHIGHKAAKMMKRSKAIERRQETALEEKAKLLHNLEHAEPLKLSQLSYHSKRLALLDDVSLFYDEHPVCQHVSFSIEQGDRIALCGANGSGKSSLLKLLCGENIAHTGNLQLGNKLILSLVPQDTAQLAGSLSDFSKENKLDESLLKTILRKLGFSREQFDKDMRAFSAGQKKKVLIANSLCRPAHLYLWDEALNFIDLISRMQIESLLLEFCPTILLVEHDSVFCEKIANKSVFL